MARIVQYSRKTVLLPPSCFLANSKTRRGLYRKGGKLMNNLGKATITTLEIAEMMEVPHGDILKKLEGRKDRKGYIQIMTEGQMSVSDFFIPSSYKDASGTSIISATSRVVIVAFLKSFILCLSLLLSPYRPFSSVLPFLPSAPSESPI